jgi:hypothetical protein
VSRVRFLEVSGLAIKVCALLGAADPGVDVGLFAGAVGCVVVSEKLCDAVDAIEALAARGAKVRKPSGGRPAAKGGGGEAILGAEEGPGLVG